MVALLPGNYQMKKLILIAAAVAMLSGCSTLSHIDGGIPVSCTGIYTGGTFGMNEGQGFPVHIDRIRTDRFGREYIRVNSSLDIHFMGSWEPRAFLKNITCDKKES